MPAGGTVQPAPGNGDGQTWPLPKVLPKGQLLVLSDRCPKQRPSGRLMLSLMIQVCHCPLVSCAHTEKVSPRQLPAGKWETWTQASYFTLTVRYVHHTWIATTQENAGVQTLATCRHARAANPLSHPPDTVVRPTHAPKGSPLWISLLYATVVFPESSVNCNRTHLPVHNQEANTNALNVYLQNHFRASLRFSDGRTGCTRAAQHTPVGQPIRRLFHQQPLN